MARYQPNRTALAGGGNDSKGLFGREVGLNLGLEFVRGNDIAKLLDEAGNGLDVIEDYRPCGEVSHLTPQSVADANWRGFCSCKRRDR